MSPKLKGAQLDSVINYTDFRNMRSIDFKKNKLYPLNHPMSPKTTITQEFNKNVLSAGSMAHRKIFDD